MTKPMKQSRGSKGSSIPYREVVGLIRRGRSFLVTTHTNPDGDALGSALALGSGLQRFKKKVKIYNQDPVPGNLRFLPHWERVTSSLAPEEKFDAAFIVDCADRDRPGELFANHKGFPKLVVVDHHVLSGKCGDINLIDTAAASSGVVVFALLKKLGVPLNRELATHIYCTLVTDTGNFRYSNTNAEVLKLAETLVRQGVEPWVIAKNIYESYPIARLKLMGKVLPTLEVSSDARYASLLLTRKMLEETGASSELSEEFVNFPRSVDTIEVSIFFREVEDNFYKISFRSKNYVDVAAIAARFEGGGHVRAAGCKLKGTLDEIKRKILAAVEEAFRK